MGQRGDGGGGRPPCEGTEYWGRVLLATRGLGAGRAPCFSQRGWGGGHLPCKWAEQPPCKGGGLMGALLLGRKKKKLKQCPGTEDRPPYKGAVLGWGSPSFLQRGRVLAPSLQELRLLGEGGTPSSPEGRVFWGGEGNTCVFPYAQPLSQEWEMVMRISAEVQGVPVRL